MRHHPSQHSAYDIDPRKIVAENALALDMQVETLQACLDKKHLLVENLQSAMFLFQAAL
jgi:hypothetical protein